MSCKTIKIWDFCTIQESTVLAKPITINIADSSSEIEMKIYEDDVLKKTLNVQNGLIERKAPNKWEIKSYKETLSPRNYKYNIFYKKGDYERPFLMGTITVKPNR